jgi:hypothetical protein
MKISAAITILALTSAPLAAAEWYPEFTPEKLAAVETVAPGAPAGITPHDGLNYSAAEEMLIMEFRLSGISLNIPESEVIRQEKMYPGQVSFENAFRQALNSFLGDYSDATGPLARTLKTLAVASAKPSRTELLKARQDLLRRLNFPGAFIALVRPYRAYQPRSGEKVEQNWIFFLREGGVSYWAVVDRSGGRQAYSYGVN